MEKALWNFYIGGEMWRGLFEVIILAEEYNKGEERYGEACLEFLYLWRNIEMPV